MSDHMQKILWDIIFLYEKGLRTTECRKLSRVYIMSDNRVIGGYVYKTLEGVILPLIENCHPAELSVFWLTIKGFEKVGDDPTSYKQVLAIRPSQDQNPLVVLAKGDSEPKATTGLPEEVNEI